MSYYLALFGPPVDLAGIQGVRALADANVPRNALRGMTELAVAYALPGARFVVDETGDTAHDLVSDPWEPPEGFARFESTRLAEIVRRAEEAGASLAIWDACWDEASSEPAVVLKDYSAFQRHLSESESGYFRGLLCIPERPLPRVKPPVDPRLGESPSGPSGSEGAMADRRGMPVERRLSIRDPGVQRGVLLCAALAFAGGLGLQAVVQHMLRGLYWAPSDSEALQAAAWFTGLALFVATACLLLGAAFFRAFRQAIAEQRMPPPGPWATGAVRIVTGKPAVLLGRVGIGLALALGLAGLALGGYSLWFVRGVIACAAKNL